MTIACIHLRGVLFPAGPAYANENQIELVGLCGLSRRTRLIFNFRPSFTRVQACCCFLVGNIQVMCSAGQVGESRNEAKQTTREEENGWILRDSQQGPLFHACLKDLQVSQPCRLDRSRYGALTCTSLYSFTWFPPVTTPALHLAPTNPAQVTG